MKLGIIGSGMIVYDLLTFIDIIDEIELTAILGRKESQEKIETLINKHHIKKAYYDYDELLNDDEIDTIYVALPNHLHYEYTKKALLHNKHVICEKPFTSNVNELDELIALAKRGEILPAFDVNKSGGALMDLNVYNIHFVVGLFGAPNKVEYFANIEKGIDTSGVAILEYPTFKAICIGAKDCGAPIISTIQGDQGCVKIDGPTSVLTDVQILRNGRDSEILPTGNYHRMYSEFKVFAECIDNNDFTTCNKMLEHSRIVMDVLTKARQSANIIFGCERDTK